MAEGTPENSRQQQFEKNADSNFDVIMSINGTAVETPTILSLVVREWVFDVLPRLELEIYDTGRFVDQYPLQDNDEIKLEMTNNSTKKPVVDVTFTLQDYDIMNGEPGKSDSFVIKITGILKTTDMLYPIHNRSFSGLNSREVFKQISEDNGFTYDPKITPRDKMTWLQIDQNNLHFMDHVLKRSYVVDDVPFVYVTRKNEMVYTSLKREIEKEKIKKKLIYNINQTIISTGQHLATPDKLNETLEEEKKTLGDDVSFYMNWQYKNVSGTINKKSAYGQEYKYYDLKKEIRGTIESDEILLSTHSNKEKDKIKNNIVKSTDFGEFDKSNTHENYIKSMIQNQYLKDNFFNSYLLVYARPEEDIDLFDIIDVSVDSVVIADSTTDEVHSGTYVVGGIMHTISKKSIPINILILFRNGRNISGYLKPDEVRHNKAKGKLSL